MANPFSQTTRSLAGDRSRYGLALWLLASAILCAWLWWFLCVGVSVYEVSRAARIEVARAAHPITTAIAGKILSNHVELETWVEAGQILVELDARTERLKLEEEEARLRSIPPQLEAIRRQIADEEQAAERIRTAATNAVAEARARHKEALSAAQFAKDRSDRLLKLRTSGNIPEIDALHALSDADKTRSAADALASEIGRLDADALGKSHEKRAAVEALRREAASLAGQLAQATATVERLKQDIEKHLIRAPISGKIGEAIPLDTGAFLQSGGTVGRVVPDGELRIIAEFEPARVLGRVHPRQGGRMRLDGFPWTQYGSLGVKVDRVSTEIREGSVRVELKPESGRDTAFLLQHGLPGTVEVEVEQVTPAVLVLRAAGQLMARPARQALLQARAEP